MIARRPPIQVLKASVNYAARWGAVAYWKLDEASGPRVGSVGSSTLADNNGVTQATGKLGNAAQFTAASSQSLSVADNPSLSTGDVDFWLAAWVYFDSTAGTRGLVTKWAAATDKEYALYYNVTANRFSWIVSANGNTDVQVDANNFGAASIATWYFVLCWHDAVNNTVNISVNAGAANSVSHAGGVRDGAAPFRLGVDQSTSYFSGRLDAVAFGKSPPGGVAGVIAEIRDRLYFSGAGLEYPWN